MNRLRATLSVLVVLTALPAYTALAAENELLFGGPGDDGATSLITTSDGGFLIGGWTLQESKTGMPRPWLVRADRRAGIMWDALPGEETPGRVSALSETIDGGALIALASDPQHGSAERGRLIQIGPDGTVEQALAIGGRGIDSIDAIRPMADGGYVMAGRTTSASAGGFDGWVVRLDRDLSTLWFRVLGGAGDDVFNTVVPLPTGRVLVGGYRTLDGNRIEGWLVKLASSGATMWTRTYEIAKETRVTGLAVTPLGETITAGYTVRAPDDQQDAWLAAIDDDGSLQWTQQLGGPDDDAIVSLAVSPSGYLLAVGNTQGRDGGSRQSPLAIGFTASGSVLFQRTHRADTPHTVTAALPLADGAYAMAGTAPGLSDGRADLWLQVFTPTDRGIAVSPLAPAP